MIHQTLGALSRTIILTDRGTEGQTISPVQCLACWCYKVAKQWAFRR